MCFLTWQTRLFIIWPQPHLPCLAFHTPTWKLKLYVTFILNSLQTPSISYLPDFAHSYSPALFTYWLTSYYPSVFYLSINASGNTTQLSSPHPSLFRLDAFPLCSKDTLHIFCHSIAYCINMTCILAHCLHKTKHSFREGL